MYYSYAQGNGPFHIWGENPPRISSKRIFNGEVGKIVTDHGKLIMPENAKTVYSDRLYQWDSEKHDTLCRKHFGDIGQYWHTRSEEKISAFLSDYLDKPVEVVGLWQYNNASSGFPVWLIFFRPVVS